MTKETGIKTANGIPDAWKTDDPNPDEWASEVSVDPKKQLLQFVANQRKDGQDRDEILKKIPAFLVNVATGSPQVLRLLQTLQSRRSGLAVK